MCLQNWVKPHRSFWYLFFVFPNLSTYTKHSLRLWRYSLLMSLYHLPSFTAYLDHLFPQIIILWDSLKIHITVWNYLASFTYELWRYQGDPPLSLSLSCIIPGTPLHQFRELRLKHIHCQPIDLKYSRSGCGSHDHRRHLFSTFPTGPSFCSG